MGVAVAQNSFVPRGSARSSLKLAADQSVELSLAISSKGMSAASM